MFNERLYFCLEERSLTTTLLKKKLHIESMTNMIHQLSPSAVGGIDINNPDNQRVLIENDMTLELLSKLQVLLLVVNTTVMFIIIIVIIIIVIPSLSKYHHHLTIIVIKSSSLLNFSTLFMLYRKSIVIILVYS